MTTTADPPPSEAECAIETAADAAGEPDAEKAAAAAPSPSDVGNPPPPGGGCSGAGCCRSAWDYGGVPEARGYALLAMGRGVAVMSNVVVNAALLELAQRAAGCPTGDELKSYPDDYICENKVYGLNPLSLISNIGVVTGVLAALFQPSIGVVLDYTSYRRFVGILFSAVFASVQACQIAIGPGTWFPMAILMSFAGFCFTVMIMTTLAYLPEICEAVGQRRHEAYTARFTAKQFAFQASFLVALGGLSFATGISDDSTATARLSQGMNVALLAVLFTWGWREMPTRPPSRELPAGVSGCLGILRYGLRQNVLTAKSINREYKKGLRWYLLSTVFAQSAVGALTTTSVVYLSSEVGLNATDISLFFLAVLVGTVPGSRIAPVLSERLDPSSSWQLSMVTLFVIMVIGAFTLGNTPNKYLSLIWGFFVGLDLGWFYPTENLFFSFVNPKGKEAEISGFRVYCSAILSWLPPLLFAILVEQGIGAKWGLTVMASFVLVAAFMLRYCAGSWEEILKESGRSATAARSFEVEL